MRIPAPATGALLAIAAMLATIPDQGNAAAATKIAREKKQASACVGLSESACGGMASCYWRKATLLKSGKTRRAHCRLKSRASKKPAAT